MIEASDLGSWFTYFNATAALGLGATGTFFWNNHWNGHIVYGAEIGVSEGAEASGTLGESWTGIIPLNGFLARIAKGVYNAVVPQTLINGGAIGPLNDAVTAAWAFHRRGGAGVSPHVSASCS
jgi:hypothetical protein